MIKIHEHDLKWIERIGKLILTECSICGLEKLLIILDFDEAKAKQVDQVINELSN